MSKTPRTFDEVVKEGKVWRLETEESFWIGFSYLSSVKEANILASKMASHYPDSIELYKSLFVVNVQTNERIRVELDENIISKNMEL